MITTVYSLFLTTIFICPGYFILLIKRSLYPNREIPTLDSIFACLGLSVVIATCSFWLYPALIDFLLGKRSISIWIMFMCWETVITLLAAYVVVQGAEKRWLFKIGERLKLHPSLPEPNAWQYRMRRDESGFIVVYLKDNTVIRGWFGRDSCASVSSSEQDLYLEAVYENTESGWTRMKDVDSIYIGRGEISRIEFVPSVNSGGDKSDKKTETNK